MRRKFHEAHQLSPDDPAVRQMLDQIGLIDAVEAEARDSRAIGEARLALRQARGRPLMDELQAQLIKAQSQAPPKSTLGGACAYALRQWPRLEMFLKDGRIEADDNWAENGLRPVVLGRKNFLHIGSEWGGPRLAAIWSVYGTCPRLGTRARGRTCGACFQTWRTGRSTR